MDQALAAVREGDTLVVPKLDRLARSVPDARAIGNDLLRMRTREGMAMAKAKGKLRGKQPKLSPKQQAELRRMHATGNYSIADLTELFSVSRPRCIAHSNAARPQTGPGDGFATLQLAVATGELGPDEQSGTLSRLGRVVASALVCGGC